MAELLAPLFGTPEASAIFADRTRLQGMLDFEAALALDPSDGPSKVCLHRVQEYLATPPPPDWDGVYVLQSK